jgi:CheY-like chemotaxis protein
MAPYQILVVDDNDMNLLLITKILELDGYHVSTANNAEQAILAMMKQVPDLAVLDVMMPDMDGFSLCKKLRQPPLNISAPIVMLTALNTSLDRQHALQAGANEIWSKPFDLDLFRKRIGELLNSSKSNETR